MEKRREKGIQYKNLLGYVVEDASVGQMSNHDKSVAIRAILFGAFSCLSLSLNVVLKYLHDYPQVRESIKVKNSNSCFKKIIFGKYNFTNFTY
jgi:hypothetical protein